MSSGPSLAKEILLNLYRDFKKYPIGIDLRAARRACRKEIEKAAHAGSLCPARHPRAGTDSLDEKAKARITILVCGAATGVNCPDTIFRTTEMADTESVRPGAGGVSALKRTVRLAAPWVSFRSRVS